MPVFSRCSICRVPLVPGGNPTGNKALCLLEPVSTGTGKCAEGLVHSMVCYKVTKKRKLGEHWRACCVTKLHGEIEQTCPLTPDWEPKMPPSPTWWDLSFIWVIYRHMGGVTGTEWFKDNCITKAHHSPGDNSQTWEPHHTTCRWLNRLESVLARCLGCLNLFQQLR